MFQRRYLAPFLFVACVAIGSTPALADQTSTDPCGDTNLLATTDRPTFGTNPCVVKPGDAIIEFGYRNTTTTNTPDTLHVSLFPQNRDRFGLAKNLELIIDAPSGARLTGNGVSATGSTDLGTGLKYEFGHVHGFVDGVAFEIVHGTGSAAFNNNALPSFIGSYQIGGPIAHNLGFNLTLGFDASHKSTAFTPSLIVGAAIAPKTKLNLEIANISTNGPGTGGQYFGNIFLQHQFSKTFLFDVEAAERLANVNGSHQSYVGVGGSIRL